MRLVLQLRSWPKMVQMKFNFTIYPITFPKDNAREWKKLFKPCASQRLFLPVGQHWFLHDTLQYTLNHCQCVLTTVCFVTRCPADPEGGGLFALRRHRYHFPAAGRGDLEPPLSLQLHPPGCNGTWTRGATHRLVQPFCTPPVLRQNWGQLRGHAHEHDAAQGKIFSGMVWQFLHLYEVVKKKKKCESNRSTFKSAQYKSVSVLPIPTSWGRCCHSFKFSQVRMDKLKDSLCFKVLMQ